MKLKFMASPAAVPRGAARTDLVDVAFPMGFAAFLATRITGTAARSITAADDAMACFPVMVDRRVDG